MKIFSPERVEEALKGKGWSVHELCVQMTLAGLGVTYSGARAWVKGKAMPRADALGALSDVFGQPVDFFFVNVTEEGSHEVVSQSQIRRFLGSVEEKSLPACPEDLQTASDGGTA